MDLPLIKVQYFTLAKAYKKVLKIGESSTLLYYGALIGNIDLTVPKMALDSAMIQSW